ncbi:uncharacterized protein LOC134834630 isoform X2 [Culicoides brevitarsis]|uniref:uncharacterized protein LOC134834630 isoform X2 n=1 Tax=Culicoides brevitarsis TaxID=469753 RepID=UPI00307BECA4
MAPQQRVNNKKVKSSDKEKKEKTEKTEENAESGEGSGLRGYLSSEQGSNFMKMFVMMNSLVMFLTMGVPAMKQAYEIARSWLEEWGWL